MYYVVYGFLWLISILPMRVLYVLADGIYVLAYYVFKYRKDVVMKNLLQAFPEKTDAERTAIAKAFYHNFIDTLFESIKFITISKKEIERRSTADFEMLHQLAAKGLNIHLLGGHQFNWEFGNVLYSKNLTIPFIGIYMPFQNWTEKIQCSQNHIMTVFIHKQKKISKNTGAF